MLVRILMVVMLALLLSPLAAADKGRKLYKWTDKDGNIHYSDSIPPEAKEYARERLSNQGVSVEQIDRAMTPEELAAVKAAEKSAAEKAAEAERQRKADEALLNSYASEDDLTRAYNQRMDLLAQSIDARRIEINSREQSLAKLVAQAAEMERAGRPVSDALKQMITGERAEIDRQKAFMAKKEAEKITAKSDYERDFAKYKAALARTEASKEQPK
ncbi:MAG: DUF4124 domain-containing protein [Rhodanobacteraceae bacterium]|nr:DUF4124 domain-containing protein [Rhodanobacteraceae bacterium]